MRCGVEYRVMSGAGLAFAIGAFVYPFRAWSGYSSGVFLESFPALAHAAFFTLLWAFPFRSILSAWIGSFLVLSLITAFELFQNKHVLSVIEPWLSQPVAEYAKFGVYDPQDMMAGVSGVVIALVISISVARKRNLNIKR